MTFAPLLAFTDADGWHAGIGDPTLVGWITVAAYFAAAFTCFRAAGLSHGNYQRESRAFWKLLALGLVLLGINKQLDLQTWLTLTGKKIAQSQGWYENRRPVQVIFILVVAMVTAAVFFGMLRLVRHQSGWVRLALAGMAFLGGFIVIRAASFHHVDQMLRHDIGGFRLNWLLELGGIGMIGYGAWRGSRADENRVGGGPRVQPRCC